MCPAYCLAAALLLAPQLPAGEDLGEEVRRLREALAEGERRLEAQRARIDALELRDRAGLAEAVGAYLEAHPAHLSAQGFDRGPLDGVKISARLTGVLQGTVGLSPSDRTVGDGDLDLDFEFTITESLRAFASLTANSGGGGAFEVQFGPVATPSGAFPPIAGPTGAALFDGIGVNGTQPTRPGSVDSYEAGILYTFRMGNTAISWELGQLDPRRRFAQNRFADDENTQFLNNAFDDPSSVNWLSDASGRQTFGSHMWLDLGEAYRLSWGWFNTSGQLFKDGQLFVQLAWKGSFRAREVNVRLYGFLDSFTEASAGEEVTGGGISADWMLSAKTGLFFRIGANGGEFNPVESDASVGLVVTGLLPSRPDDTFGVAVGWISLQAVVAGPLAGFAPVEDTELTVEIYYRYVLENGKLQVTPSLQLIRDPGGGAAPWQDDLLLLLGLRIFVPF
jgi:hypothetical protein